MSKIQEALKAAIEAMYSMESKIARGFNGSISNDEANAINLCKSALAEIYKCAPVLKVTTNGSQLARTKPNGDYWDMSKHINEVFYTSPISKGWVGLDDDDLFNLFEVHADDIVDLVAATEAKLKQLNAPEKG